jgi:hypothetical protein
MRAELARDAGAGQTWKKSKNKEGVNTSVNLELQGGCRHG